MPEKKKTSSSAVAEKPRDALCPSVVVSVGDGALSVDARTLATMSAKVWYTLCSKKHVTTSSMIS